ncbi:MAG: hypothetical protein ACFFCD_15085 [Promethearchaeota archaeon]
MSLNISETDKPNVFQVELYKKRFRLNIRQKDIEQIKRHEFAFIKLTIFCNHVHYLMNTQGDMLWTNDMNADKENPLFFYDPDKPFESLYDLSGSCAKEIEDVTPWLELVKQKMNDDEEHTKKEKNIDIAPYLKLIEQKMNE